MNDDSFIKLIDDIKPRIHNIEENRLELKSLKNVQSTMEELIVNAKESYHEIFNFYDQDFIKRAIMINNSNYQEQIKKYDSSKYLLSADNPDLTNLPQYQEALIYVDNLYKYLYGLYESINLDYNNKREDLEIQELFYKYYIIFNKDNVFVKDIDEFLSVIELSDLDGQDRINIYKNVIRSNLKYYLKENEIDINNNKPLIYDNKMLDKDNIKKENLMLNMDTLDIKREDKNAK